MGQCQSGPPRLVAQKTHTWVSHDDFADVGMSAYAEGQEFDEKDDIQVFENCAVMVSDLSGFTKLIKNHGEIYLASVIIRCRQLALPTINGCDPLSVSYEADNLIVVFEDIKEALEATLMVQHIIQEYRKSFISEDKDSPYNVDSAPKLGGLGLHAGTVSKHRMRHKLYGNTFIEGYHLGEEVADKSLEISETIFDKLPKNVQAFFERNEEGEKEHGEAVPFKIYTRSFKDDPCEVLKALRPDVQIKASRFPSTADTDAPGIGPLFAPADDDRFLHPNLIPFCKMHLPDVASNPEAFAKAKASLKRKWTSEGVALVYEVLFSPEASAQHQIGLEVKLQHLVNNSAVKYGGYAANEKVVLFPTACDAVKGTVALRQALTDYNSDVKENAPDDRFDCRGYGLHVSQIVNVQSTDIQFGYAINVASKMGEDCATGGVILLSPEVYKQIEEEECFKEVNWTRDKMTASGATYEPYVLNEPDGIGSLKLAPPDVTTAQLIAEVENNRRHMNKLEAELESLKRDIPMIVARALSGAKEPYSADGGGGDAGAKKGTPPDMFRQHTFNATTTTNRTSVKGRNKIVLSQPSPDTAATGDDEGMVGVKPQVL